MGMIEIKNATKYYGRKELGLYMVSARINKGEVVGILGQNGSGKTTLLKAIMGLTELNEGKILIEGKPPTQMYHKMAFITEEGSYFPWMTPYEYGAFLSDFIPGFNLKLYRSLLDFFEIEPFKKISSLSTGQKSKLEISAGFSKGAQYILMDEPFLGSDIFTRKDFLKLLISNLKQDETILIATHIIEDIENFIDRAIILKFGRIKADLYIDDIRKNGKSLESVMMEAMNYDESRYKKVSG